MSSSGRCPAKPEGKKGPRARFGFRHSLTARLATGFVSTLAIPWPASVRGKACVQSQNAQVKQNPSSAPKFSSFLFFFFHFRTAGFAKTPQLVTQGLNFQTLKCGLPMSPCWPVFICVKCLHPLCDHLDGMLGRYRTSRAALGETFTAWPPAEQATLDCWAR